MLVLDAFHGHLSEEITVKLYRKNCDLVVILGGMTSQITSFRVLFNTAVKIISGRNPRPSCHLKSFW
jgi:hypothetical protein